MAKDYSTLARELLDATGGSTNVANVTHCATRLRFNLKDSSKADAERAKQIEGVITVVEKGGQFQVVIGNTVPEVFRAVTKAGGLDNLTSSNDNDDAPKGNLLNRLIDVIAGVFPPILGALCGAGLIKGLLAILTAAKLIVAESGTYLVLNAIGDSVFYFLPVLLGFSAGRKFKANPYVTALVGAALIHPSIVAEAGTTISFLGLPMVMINYSSTVIPILFAAWLCSKLEKFLNNRLPSAVKNFLTPMICLVVTVPLTLLAIGPVCTWLANGLAGGYQGLFGLNPAIAGAFVGALWQVLVIFGVHWSFVAVMLNNVTAMGFDTLGPIAQIGAMGQTGAALGMMLKMKNPAQRSLTLSTVVAGVFGVTEPIVYGVTLPRKKPFIMGMIGGAIGGAVGGAMGATGYSVGALGVFSLAITIGPEGVGSSFFGALVGMLLSLVIATVLSFLTYKDDTMDKAQVQSGPGKARVETPASAETAPEEAPVSTAKSGTVYSPMLGESLPLPQSKDPVHAQEALGKGAIIIPSEGRVYAPFDGNIEIVFDSKHAIGLMSDDGVELLIHVGMDTVKLEGKYFNAHVTQGERVTKGQLLLEFDLDSLVKEGFDLESPIIVTNTPDYAGVDLVAKGAVTSCDLLIRVG